MNYTRNFISNAARVTADAQDEERTRQLFESCDESLSDPEETAAEECDATEQLYNSPNGPIGLHIADQWHSSDDDPASPVQCPEHSAGSVALQDHPLAMPSHASSSDRSELSNNFTPTYGAEAPSAPPTAPLMPLQPESVANIAVSGNAGPGLDPVHVWKMPSAASIPPQSFTPPIATLPTELLAEIFLCATPLYLWDAKPNAEPLVISQVCRNWRFIAIHLPGLWRRLSLTGCTSRSTHHRLDLAKTYMSRSMHMGMSISYRDTEALTVISKIWKSAAIRGREASEAPAEGRCHCVLDLIIARIGEVHTLDLVIGHVSSLRLSVVPPATASMLKHLSVRFYEGGNHTQALSCFYASLPQLEHLKWGNYLKACRVPHPTGAPWSELVTANIADCRTTHEAFLQIMHSGQRLQAVTVRLLSAARLTAPSTLIQVKQNVLEMLTICGDGPIDAVFFALQLPSLRSLTLRSTAREGSIWPFSDIQALHHCILGIEGGLNSFTMTRAESINEGDLIATLALPQMATLRNLDVHIPLLSDGFFTKLNPEYGPPLVSCLDRLNVANCATTDETISRMILMRLQTRYPLQRAHIAFTRQEEGLHVPHPHDLAEFRRFQEFGAIVTSGC